MNHPRKQQSTPGFNFTLDIIIEILSRLPASSLARFKFVCKEWHALITADPILANLHFTRGFNTSPPSIITGNHEGFTLMDADGRHSRQVSAINYRYITPSCNGLVCIYNSKDIMLFNPTTLQKFEVKNPTKLDEDNITFSLGYVPSTKEYKLVRFSNRNRGRMFCKVLTVGTYSWRKITIKFGIGCKVRGGVTVNGLMYMIVNPSRLMAAGTRVRKIYSFDFDSEKFEKVVFPWPESRELDSVYELEGCVCARVVPSHGVMELWMLENATSDGWIRKYKWWVAPCQPVLIHAGWFLVQSQGELWNCSPETGEKMEKISDGNALHPYAQVHIESLVSLSAP